MMRINVTTSPRLIGYCDIIAYYINFINYYFDIFFDIICVLVVVVKQKKLIKAIVSLKNIFLQLYRFTAVSLI